MKKTPRFGLPEISFIDDIDVNSIQTKAISIYEDTTGLNLTPGDPERLFLQAVIYFVLNYVNRIDVAAKKNLLAYAEGDALDHYGARVAGEDGKRLSAQAAQTTLIITIEPDDSDYVFAAGKRAATASGVIFQTTETITILAGEITGQAIAECAQTGEIGNDFMAGQINRLVDPSPRVLTIENITISNGGSDAEEDDRYAERLYYYPLQFSTAGPEDAYKFWAMTAHTDIIDVSVTNPSAGVVRLCPLMKNSELPSDEIQNAVIEICSSKIRRPQTDNVETGLLEFVGYDLSFTYYVKSDYEKLKDSIDTAVSEKTDSYIDWQCAKIGRKINPSYLHSLLMTIDGMDHVEISSPATVVGLLNSQVAQLNGAAEAIFGGFVDD